MDLRRRIDTLLALPNEEFGAEAATELEDVLQRGFAAVQVGELWVLHLRRELDGCSASDEDRLRGLTRELRSAERSVAAVRDRVARLYERAQACRVGAAAATVAGREPRPQRQPAAAATN